MEREKRFYEDQSSHSESGSSLCNILLSKNECLASLDGLESSSLADSAFELESDLLGSLGLLSEDRLSLASKSSLLGIITSLSLSDGGSLTSLVLTDLVDYVFLALRTVGSHLLGNVHLNSEKSRDLPLSILIINIKYEVE